MLSITNNILLAYGARAWAIVLALILTPFYIRVLGIESYAIVGITFSIQAIMCLFDFGFGGATTLTTASYIANDRRTEIRNLFRTGEILYWSAALILLGIFYLFSDVVARTWFSNVASDQFDLKKVISLMGGIVIVQWPCIFYNGGLLGLQRQDIVNKIQLLSATARALFAVAAITLLSPTIYNFLLAQMITGFLQTSATAIALWRLTDGGFWKGRLDKGVFVETGKKALKISMIAGINIVTLHIDKIVLSHYLDLKSLGYYCFSWTLVNGIFGLCAILNTIFGPRFSLCVAKKETKELVHSYHQGAQWMSIIIFPITLFFLFFSREVLTQWCKNPDVVANSYVVASLLIAGTCLSCLGFMPHCLQLAHQWMRLTIVMSACAFVLYFPTMLILSFSYGMVGAAIAWVLLQFFFLVIYLHLMHRKLIPEEKKKWLFEDVLLPFAGAFCAAVLCKWLLGPLLQKSG
ncbi:MAG: MATE family efflux transporter, partial [Chlamydiota bacterium]